MNDSVKNMIAGSIVLVLAALYGGQTLGSWFYVQGEMEEKDGDGVVEFKANFNLKGWEYEVTVESGDEKEEYDGDPDYDDRDCALPDERLIFTIPDVSGPGDCDELLYLMQGEIQNLLYVVILAGFAALYFLNDGDQERGALACLAMGGAGLFAAALFALNFPEALDDDTEAFEIIDDDPSLLGDNNDYDEEYSDSRINWRPGLAFALVTLSGIIGMSAYAELKSS